jgi:predicted nucleic acid-binding protein
LIVVDAGVVATALTSDDDDGRRARSRLRDERLTAPELLDLEVLSVLRRHTSSGQILLERASLAIADLAELPVVRVPHRPLLARCWELRHNLTPYDAAYVTLAESIDAVLLTTDARLARAPGPQCQFEVLR